MTVAAAPKDYLRDLGVADDRVTVLRNGVDLDACCDGQAEVIDGLSGDQRFFLAWAQVWRSKSRDEEAKRRLTTDPHSPAKFRANGAAVNIDAFSDMGSRHPVTRPLIALRH